MIPKESRYRKTLVESLRPIKKNPLGPLAIFWRGVMFIVSCVLLGGLVAVVFK